MTPTFIGIVDKFGFTATFLDDAPPLSRFAFLFLLQFLGGFLSQQQPKLLLSLRGHETFLGLLRFGGFLHASPDLSAFALDLLLFPLLFLLTKPQSTYLPPVYKIARILLFCILHFFASLFVASLRASSSFFLCKRNDANQKTNYLDAT
jgi:O-antigen/teichoic acid export membrane protein